MAGRFLLIEFDDEATANRMRERIDNASRQGKAYRVVGLFARPDKFCRCGTWTTERGKPSTLKQGKRLGWMVCTVCKRPAPLMGFLRNLIKPVDIINPPLYDVHNDEAKTKKRFGFYTYGLSAVGNQFKD